MDEAGSSIQKGGVVHIRGWFRGTKANYPQLSQGASSLELRNANGSPFGVVYTGEVLGWFTSYYIAATDCRTALLSSI
ncbi:MAG: hypothetical protein ACFFC5_00525 [Promethearchaeota archaeon]